MIPINGNRISNRVFCMCPATYTTRKGDREHENYYTSYIDAGIDGENTFITPIEAYGSGSPCVVWIDPDAEIQHGDYIAVEDEDGRVVEKFFYGIPYDNCFGKIAGRVHSPSFYFRKPRFIQQKI